MTASHSRRGFCRCEGDYFLEFLKTFKDYRIFMAKGDQMKLDRITSDPKRMNGQPCVRDLRLTVRRVLELVALYPDRDELRREFPELEQEDVRQALEYAAASLDDRIIELNGNHETAA
jgi:uncharacterized protein (DUF433 family)